jgi:hypothetical protein
MDIIDAKMKEISEKYTYGDKDLEAGVSKLETGKLHFVYE